jgi:alpha-glucuronidase
MHLCCVCVCVCIHIRYKKRLSDMLRLLKSSGMNGVALEDVNSCGTKEQRNEKKDKTKTKTKRVLFNQFWIYVTLHGIETDRFDQDRLGTNAGKPPQQKNTHSLTHSLTASLQIELNAIYLGIDTQSLDTPYLKNVSKNLGPLFQRWGLTPYLSVCYAAPKVHAPCPISANTATFRPFFRSDPAASTFKSTLRTG